MPARTRGDQRSSEHANALSYYLLARHLKREHSAVWEELGRPSLVVNNSIASVGVVRRFANTRHYLQLADKHVERLVALWRWTGRLALVFLAAYAAVFVMVWS